MRHSFAALLMLLMPSSSQLFAQEMDIPEVPGAIATRHVRPGTRGNLITLGIDNYWGTSGRDSLVIYVAGWNEYEAIGEAAPGVHFPVAQQKILLPLPGEKQEVAFRFDVDDSVSTARQDTIHFIMYIPTPLFVQKSVVLRYGAGSKR